MSERERAAKIEHLVDVGIEGFSVLDPPTEKEIEIVRAMATMIVHGERMVISECCDELGSIVRKIREGEE